jgi:nucleoside-diphosphate-sugar epimerase
LPQGVALPTLDAMNDTEIQRALVTGGSGFLGRALVAHLLAQGVAVRVLDQRAHPDPAVPSVVGDLRDADVVARACEGVDTVFHTAAMIDWSLNKRALLHAVNVQGTDHVIAACHAAGVTRLVFTSTVDVVFSGAPIVGADEAMPYPSTHLDDYAGTKAEAERRVLAANGDRGLRTCALRVATLWGPGERFRIPRFVEMARGGKLMGLGDGSARFNHLYVTNAAHAHWLAALALCDVGSPAAGEAFFILDGEPTNFFEFYSPLLARIGCDARWRWTPAWLVYPFAVLSEAVNRRRSAQTDPPLLTRFTVTSTAGDFWFRSDKARRLFGYTPTVPAARAVDETVAWMREEFGDAARA